MKGLARLPPGWASPPRTAGDSAATARRREASDSSASPRRSSTAPLPFPAVQGIRVLLGSQDGLARQVQGHGILPSGLLQASPVPRCRGFQLPVAEGAGDGQGSGEGRLRRVRLTPRRHAGKLPGGVSGSDQQERLGGGVRQGRQNRQGTGVRRDGGGLVAGNCGGDGMVDFNPGHPCRVCRAFDRCQRLAVVSHRLPVLLLGQGQVPAVVEHRGQRGPVLLCEGPGFFQIPSGGDEPTGQGVHASPRVQQGYDSPAVSDAAGTT